MISRRFLFTKLVASIAILSGGAVLAESQNTSIDRPYVDVATVKAAMVEGKTIVVTWKTEWCSTCNMQKRVFDTILTEEPTLAEKIMFLDLNWDEYSNHSFTKNLNIPRRSTIVVFKGMEELGRLIAATNRSEIEKLILKAL